MNRQGSILVGLLWCLALLSVVVFGILHTSRMDLVVAANFRDGIQARYLALAGVEKAKALLYHDARDRTRSRQHHSGQLYDSPAEFASVTLGRGDFRIFRRGAPGESGTVVFGVSDEESRLNLNVVSPEELAKLRGMTTDRIAALADWRDADTQPEAGGAEVEYYASLTPPSRPRDGPLLSVRELLMVRGYTREDLFGLPGRDLGMGAIEGEAGNSSTPDTRSDAFDGDEGWARWFTVHSGARDVDAGGEARVNIQTADESALSRVPGVTPEIARAIVAYRAQNRFEDITQLLDVTAPQPGGGSQPPVGVPPGSVPGVFSVGAPPGASPGAQGRPQVAGPRVIDEGLFLEIADLVTVAGDEFRPGLVNLNTAPLEVLECLPGMTRELAQAVIHQRASAGYFESIAGVLRVSGFTREILRQLAPRVTVRSETFRITAEGRIRSSGITSRVQAVVRVGPRAVQTLAYREDDL